LVIEGRAKTEVKPAKEHVAEKENQALGEAAGVVVADQP